MTRTVAVCDRPEEVAAFVARGLWGGTRRFGPSTAIGFATPDAGLVAGVVYHNYDPHAGTIELSGYAARRDWANRAAVALIFGGYPFRHAGCRLLLGRHSERNARVRRIWRALGATEHPIPDLRAEGEAEIVAVLKRDVFLKSRFMRSRHG